LRRAELGDAPLLAELGARLFQQAFGTENDPSDMRAYIGEAFDVEVQRAELTDEARHVLLAEDANGGAIGYAVLRRGAPAGDDGAVAAVAAVAAAPVEVARIYVDGAWHGRGPGDALMDACVAQARAWRCDALWLGVWERNARAIAFYGRRGFRAVSTQTFLLGRDRQKDLVMLRSLG
jgi:GNAT superfamily N-acetyltransferase